jgi:hypothetical protein
MGTDARNLSVLAGDKKELQSVPLKIRLVIAAIFVLGACLVFLPSLTNMIGSYP